MGQVQQRVLRRAGPAGLLMLAASLLLPSAAQAQKFYADDPLERDPAPVNVEKPYVRKISDYYDFFKHIFARPGERQAKPRIIPAGGVNTLGEVPDSPWYTNRHGRKRMTVEELARGPRRGLEPADGPWRVLRAKTEGVTPGFTVEDRLGHQYVLKFDPVTNPEMATAADVIGALFFHALGYHVPENYLVTFDRDRLQLTPETRFTDRLGKKRAMDERDLDEILMNVPRSKDKVYRAVASLYLEGEPLGPFRFHGTRRDDPNDVVPHEHRRDLRGLGVFSAWLGHDDSRAINTLDTLVEQEGRRFLRHHLIDFGSTLGSASVYSNSARSGNEHLFAVKPALAQAVTLGLYVPRWMRAHYPNLPSVGRFEHEVFDPEKYKTEYPNPAFLNRLPDDNFWAARQVMRFTNDDIRAIVKEGRYSDRRAEEWVAQCLIARRDKIGRAYFTKVLPLDAFEVRDGRLAFVDLAAKYDLAPAQEYAAGWFRFDNRTEKASPLSGRTGLVVPPEIGKAGAGEYFMAEIWGKDERKRVRVYLRSGGGAAQIVGIERIW